MTTETTSGVPAARVGGHPSLARVAAVDAATFAERYWGQQPLLSVAADLPRPFDDLFGNDAVDELVSRRGLRAPFLRVAKNGTTLPDRAFTSGGGIGAGIADQASDDKLLALFADGATIVLQGLHRTWPPLVEFGQGLAADLGHPVQVNAYVTPPQSTGFDDHYDVHDVFVLQVAGSKCWRIRPPVVDLPLRDDPWTDHREQVAAASGRPPLIEVTLQPGDCLYLPRGYLHAATALGDVSTHLTVGTHPWTRRHLADELVAAAVAQASREAAVRAALPLGTDLADPATLPGPLAADVELVRAALLRALESVDAADLSAALARRARDSQRAAPVSPVAQVRDATALTDADTLVLRDHLMAQLVEPGDGAPVLVHRGGQLSLHPDDVDAVRRLLAAGSAEVGDLGLELSRRLLRGGAAVRRTP